MLKEEMTCLLQYYSDKYSIITSTIAQVELEPSSPFNRGAIALLNKLKWSSELLLKKASMAFKMDETSDSATSVNDWMSESSDVSDDEF